MAVALVAMAAAQVFIGVALLRASRQMTDLAGQMRNDIRPLLEKAIHLTDEASKVTSMAVVQMERVDRITLLLAVALTKPWARCSRRSWVRSGRGPPFWPALKAVVGAIREWQKRPGRPDEDEDPLFVG